jgi:hypothetical protein
MQRVLSAAAGLFLALSSSAHAAPSAQHERWTMTSGAGHATLAFSTEASGSPEIMFICGASNPGFAQVIINRQPDDPNDRRFRVQFAAGSFSALASGEPAAGALRGGVSIHSEISAQQIRDLLMANAPRMQWRVDTLAFRTVAENMVVLPHALGRLRTDFLRFCV